MLNLKAGQAGCENQGPGNVSESKEFENESDICVFVVVVLLAFWFSRSSSQHFNSQLNDLYKIILLMEIQIVFISIHYTGN